MIDTSCRGLADCAWTKQIKQGEAWVPLEDYLERVHGVKITHGISPKAQEELSESVTS